GQTYYFIVKAYNTANFFSEPSNELPVIMTANGPLYGAASVNPATLRFAATKTTSSMVLSSVTPPQQVTMSVSGTGSSWSATADQPWVQITNGSGASAGRFTVSIINPSDVIGA